MQYALNDTAEILLAPIFWVMAGLGTRLDGPASVRRHERLQAWSTAVLARRAERLLGLQLELCADGADALEPGPVIVLCRHVSIVDASLPALLYQRLRYRTRGVIMAELLADPGFDLIYGRTGSVFIPRDNGPEAREQIAQLGHGADPQTALVIFPEGRLFRPDRRQRSLRRLTECDPDRARRLDGIRHVIPPRPGGVLALLEALPDADVVVIAHLGLDQYPTLRELARAVPLSQPVRVDGLARCRRRHPHRGRQAHRMARRPMVPPRRVGRHPRAIAMRSRRPAWADYIDRFHAQRPGITEDVLARCTDETGANPYAWLTHGLDPHARVLDLACGSGPTHALVAGRWIGVDRSSAELSRALERGRAPLVRADLTNVPVRNDTADAVLCSMALMLIDPCSTVLDEIQRLLTPGGELRALLPATAPLTISDRWTYLRLFVAARARPRFPATPLRRQRRARVRRFETRHHLGPIEAIRLPDRHHRRRRLFHRVVVPTRQAKRQSWASAPRLRLVHHHRRSAATRHRAHTGDQGLVKVPSLSRGRSLKRHARTRARRGRVELRTRHQRSPSFRSGPSPLARRRSRAFIARRRTP